MKYYLNSSYTLSLPSIDGSRLTMVTFKGAVDKAVSAIKKCDIHSLVIDRQDAFSDPIREGMP